jgi:hypothetical protein
MNRRFALLPTVAALGVLSASAHGEVKVEKVAYLNLPNCLKVSNGTVELIITTDVGPRIIRYGFVGDENILGEVPEASVKTALGEWKPLGGHRLWHAPEAMPRTYSPDNGPIEVKQEGNTIRLVQPVEPITNIQKEMTVTLDAEGTGVHIHHKLTNRGLWGITMAPWALTIMNGGGTTILPQEPYKSHDEELLPARPFVFWTYTDLTDPRWAIGKRFIRLKTDDALKESQKIGIGNKQGWAAYHRKKVLFIKRFPWDPKAVYPDYGSNCETYTAGSFMEVETLGGLKLCETGDSVEHVERWFLFNNVDIGPTEATLDAAVTPLVGRTKL